MAETKKQKIAKTGVHTLPAIAVREQVVFPYAMLSLFMGREKSVSAAEAAMATPSKQVILLIQKNPDTEDPKREDLYDTAVIVRIAHSLRLPDGTVKAIVEGVSVCRVDELTLKGGHFEATVTEINQTKTSRLGDVESLRRAVVDAYEKVMDDDKGSAEVLRLVREDKDANRCISRTCTQIKRLTLEDRMSVLAEPDLVGRLELLLSLFERETELKDIQKRVEGRVKRQIEKNQRDFYLNEQIKAIRKELGDSGDGEFDDTQDLENRIREAKLPKTAEDTAKTELRRLRQMPPMSSEAVVVRSYIETLLDIPWTQKSRVSKDLTAAARILDEDHSGLEKVKERILEYLAVQKRVGKVKSPILCFVGAPGVGKTSLGESIARATGRKYVRIALGGVHDESEIRGHRRTYVGSMPGQIIKCMQRAGVRNPLVLLDEIDKMSSDYRGDPASAMLEVLDPEQNNSFQDHYVEIPYDLSDVMFVATSNSYNIPPALLDRMEVISLSGYTEEEKLHIAEHHLLPKLAKSTGLKKNEAEVTREAILGIIRFWTREAGVRGLERAIGKVLRKIVFRLAKADGDKVKTPVVVKEEDLQSYLGPAPYTIGLAKKEPRVGTVNGLAWTEAGGEMLTIEAQLFPGKGAVLRTGSLGDVMKESVEIARSVVRTRAHELGIKDRKFFETDLHVHFPEGATPKDGPSAGAATTLAIVSAMTGIPVKSDIAMTGEINLHGEVLQIGGLKEKLLAAVRAGCTTALIPDTNKNDLEELPESAKKALKIIPVKTIDEVLALALVSTPVPLSPEEAAEGLKSEDKEKAEGKPVAKPAARRRKADA